MRLFLYGGIMYISNKPSSGKVPAEPSNPEMNARLQSQGAMYSLWKTKEAAIIYSSGGCKKSADDKYFHKLFHLKDTTERMS